MNTEPTSIHDELRRKTDALAQANSDLHDLLDATAAATVFLDRQLRIARFTPSAAPLLNLLPTDVGRPFTDLATGLADEALADDARGVLATGAPAEREVGEHAGNWYLVRSRPYRTLDDRITGVVLSFVDVTERRRAEAARQRSEAHLRMVIENAREYAIFTMDVDRRITTWNPGAERITGHTEQEVVGRSGDLLFTPEDRAAGAPEEEASTARTEGRAGDDRFHLRKDGSRFWASGMLMSMCDGDGPIVGFVKILRDQTEQRRTQQALERSQSDLAQANVAKDRFLAVLSHELRTPLTPAVLALQMLARRRDLPDDVQRTLAVAYRNIRSESRLIDDLLDLTRITRGTLELVREPLDLHAVIRTAAEVCESDVQAKSQQLALDLRAPDARMVGDAHRLQQVVWNLLKNASKFTPDKGQVRVSTRLAGDRFLVEVADDGIGIDAAALPHIFDPFVQGGAWVAREFGGLGLGLAISKASIEAHGGSLRAESPGRGRGATFTIELPLADPGSPP